MDYNVKVSLIKPRIVNSPMTKDLGVSGPTVAEPRKVGLDIYKGLKKEKEVIYTPGFWRYIMFIVMNVPSFVLHRTKL
mgnify:FL=1